MYYDVSGVVVNGEWKYRKELVVRQINVNLSYVNLYTCQVSSCLLHVQYALQQKAIVKTVLHALIKGVKIFHGVDL